MSTVDRTDFFSKNYYYFQSYIYILVETLSMLAWPVDSESQGGNKDRKLRKKKEPTGRARGSLNFVTFFFSPPL